MSVLIENMEMPQDCAHCRFNSASGPIMALCDYFVGWIKMKDGCRADECPLAETQPERKKDTIQKFHDYQINWLKSHYDIELEPQLEEMIVRFLHDTANCYMMEIDREEGEQMRAIDADEFDKCLEDAEEKAIHMQKYVFASALNTIRGNLRIFPTIEPEPQWIPVSERLPEKPGNYLVSIKRVGWNYKEYVENDIAYWDDIFHKADKVIAWMPLPEQYRGEGD